MPGVAGLAVSGAPAAAEEVSAVFVVVVVVAGVAVSVVVVAVVVLVSASEGFCWQAVTLIKQRLAIAAAIKCFCMIGSFFSTLK